MHHLSPSLSTVQRGFLAEFYVKYYLARRGFSFLEPPWLSAGLDIVVRGQSGKLYNCEVKGATNGYDIRIQRSHYKAGKFKDHSYSASDNIDFFILVALETENVFIMPFSEWGMNKTITCSPTGVGWKWKDRIDLFI